MAPCWPSQSPTRLGMVNLLDLYPLYFDEFLEATDPALFAYYESIQKNQTIEEIFHNRLLEAYNNYLIIGGDAGMCSFMDQP